MTTDAHKETLQFQAEARQLLQLVVHSLYSNREIFLRELISNASDACDKLRFESLSDDALYEGDATLRVRVSCDPEARTITITDNGIGMSRQEVVDNIGTIARSGTRRFLEALAADRAQGLSLIGQFGVGFYSAFVVAERVTLRSRRAGLTPEHGVRWESDGQGEYTLETIDKPERGTEIVLHLRPEMDEFLDPWRLREIIRRHSDHLSLPIEMPATGKEGESRAWEQVNRGSALWTRPRNEISDEEYREFYKHVAHDFEDPLAWVHTRVEGSQSYTTLLYVPRRPPFDLWDRERHHGVRLHVRRVFVLEDTAGRLMPNYLRFIRGVVDSDDLPLNVSREILQESRQVDVIRAASVKKVLGRLQEMAQNEPEDYRRFWADYGRVLKEGPVEDPANRETIAKLLRFHSTHAEGADGNVSLDDYIARMQEGQDRIWYLSAESQAAALSSPHLEIFRKRNIEVLLLWDRIDEWMLTGLTEYAGKTLVSVARGELDPEALGGKEEDAGAGEKSEKKEEAVGEELLARMQELLREEVSAVRPSRRLAESASCLVVEKDDISLGLRRLLKSAGQDMPTRLPVLEINTTHPLVDMLRDADDTEFSALSRLLYEQALLAEGGQLPDPAGFVKRLNSLLLSGRGREHKEVPA
jgi:molecular chaperone HtpG